MSLLTFDFPREVAHKSLTLVVTVSLSKSDDFIRC